MFHAYIFALREIPKSFAMGSHGILKSARKFTTAVGRGIPLMPLRSPGFERVASFPSKAFLPCSAIRHGRRQPLPFGSKRGLPWGYGLQKVYGIARIVPPKP